MNKKGFTLTEVLAVLIILGVIMLIAIPSISDLQSNFKEKYYSKLDDTVILTAKSYFKDYKRDVPKGNSGATALPFNVLLEKKYLDSILPYNVKTANSDNKCTGHVLLVKLEEKKEYINCMVCVVNGRQDYSTMERSALCSIDIDNTTTQELVLESLPE